MSFVKNKIYRNSVSPVILYGRVLGPVTLREGHRLKAFENLVLMKVFGPRRDEVRACWRKLHNKSWMNCTSHQILFGRSNLEERDEQSMWHVLWRGEGHTEFRWGNLKKIDHLEELGVNGTVLCQRMFSKQYWEAWGGGVVEWIDLAQGRDKRRAVVNRVMNRSI